MGQITLKGVHKSFGAVEIIKDVNLDIADGSFVVFVGPSGCGKTTLLRLIAGLEDVTGGQILIDGKNVVERAARQARPLDGVPVLRALSAYERARQHRLRAQDGGPAAAPRSTARSAAAAATLNLTPYLDRKPRPALRRPAPARRHRPRHRARAQGLPVRRAAVATSTRRCACRCASRSTRLQKTAGDDRDLRHARPGRGHDHGRHDRRAERRPDRAVRLAARTLRAAGQPVRRRLHRLAQDELRHRRRPPAGTARPRSASGPSICSLRATAREKLAGHGRRSPSISAATPSSMSMPASWGCSRCAASARSISRAAIACFCRPIPPGCIASTRTARRSANERSRSITGRRVCISKNSSWTAAPPS